MMQCCAVLCCAGYAISASLLEGVLSDGKGPLVSYPSSLFVVSPVRLQAAAELQASPLPAGLVKLTKMIQQCGIKGIVKHGPVSFRPACTHAHSALLNLQPCW